MKAAIEKLKRDTCRWRTKTPDATPVVQTSHISKHVVNPGKEYKDECQSKSMVSPPIRIRWRLLSVPEPGVREFFMNSTLNFRFVINSIKTNNALQEDVQLWMSGRVFGYLKQWAEDI